MVGMCSCWGHVRLVACCCCCCCCHAGGRPLHPGGPAVAPSHHSHVQPQVWCPGCHAASSCTPPAEWLGGLHADKPRPRPQGVRDSHPPPDATRAAAGTTSLTQQSTCARSSLPSHHSSKCRRARQQALGKQQHPAAPPHQQQQRRQPHHQECSGSTRRRQQCRRQGLQRLRARCATQTRLMQQQSQLQSGTSIDCAVPVDTCFV